MYETPSECNFGLLLFPIQYRSYNPPISALFIFLGYV